MSGETERVEGFDAEIYEEHGFFRIGAYRFDADDILAALEPEIYARLAAEWVAENSDDEEGTE